MDPVNRKAETLVLCISKIAGGNLTKIFRGHNVAAKFVCANLKKNRRRPDKYPTCSSSVGIFVLFICLFLFISQGAAQTAEPILTRNTSKEPVLAKEVPFWG